MEELNIENRMNGIQEEKTRLFFLPRIRLFLFTKSIILYLSSMYCEGNMELELCQDFFRRANKVRPSALIHSSVHWNSPVSGNNRPVPSLIQSSDELVDCELWIWYRWNTELYIIILLEYVRISRTKTLTLNKIIICLLNIC